MLVQPAMLDHPFYQAWMKGELPVETLARYHRSYHRFISLIPGYWQRVISAFQPDAAGAHPVVEEERRHIALWQRWGQSLPPQDDFPRLDLLTGSLDEMSPSALLGALQAFEIQQPEVARTKKEGLLRHYGLNAGELTYFDEHEREEAHIEFGRSLARRFADGEEFEKGFSRGAELAYRSLDEFLPRQTRTE